MKIRNFIIASALLLTSINASATRIVTFINNLSTPVTLHYIDTFHFSIPGDETSAKIYHPSFWYEKDIVIEPGKSYILMHTNPGIQFPYYSPSSIPFIAEWDFKFANTALPFLSQNVLPSEQKEFYASKFTNEVTGYGHINYKNTLIYNGVTVKHTRTEVITGQLIYDEISWQ